MPHPRLTRGNPLRSRAEQIEAELKTAQLDEEPVRRQLPTYGPKVVVANGDYKTFALRH